MKLIDKVEITPVGLSSTVWETVTVPASLTGYEGAIVLFDGTTGNAQRDTVRPTGVGTTADWTPRFGNDRLYIRYVAIDANDQFEIMHDNSNYKAWLIGGLDSTEATLLSTTLSSRDITPAITDDTLQSVDLTSHLGGDTAQAAILSVRSVDTTGNKFSYGSTAVDSGVSGLASQGSDNFFIVPVVSNAVRVGLSKPDMEIYLVGYIKSGLSIITAPSNQGLAASLSTYVTASFTADRPASEDIVFLECATTFASSAGFRPVGDTDITQVCSQVQIPVSLDGSGQAEYSASFGGSQIRSVAYATNDTGPAPSTPTIDDIDTDNSVQAGQAGVVITASAIDPDSVTQSVTLGGEALTINSWVAE